MKTKVIPFESGRKWFEIRNASEASADVFLYDEIGAYGITAGDFIKELSSVRAALLNVHINSPGGSVFDGFAIYNALHNHPASITVHVDGLAASIASVIAMAGDKIVMAENAMMMIHCPTCGVIGYAKDLRAQADVLDKLEENIVKVYESRTGMKAEELKIAMEAETWFTAQECSKNGFCTDVIAAKKFAAHFDLSAFKNAPTFSAPAEDKTPLLRLMLKRLSLLESTVT